MNISLILLAAGNSKRFGDNKLLYPINGKAMYKYIGEELLENNLFYEKIIVTQYDKIRNDPLFSDYKVVLNPDSSRGISSSIILGVENANDNTDAYCFLVCDQPLLTNKTIKGLIDGFIDSGKSLATVSYGDRLGNPNLFSKEYKDELLRLTGDSGGKKVMNKYPENECYKYRALDENELIDIDNLSELENLMKSEIFN